MMKWIIPGILMGLLAGCGTWTTATTDVVEYRNVAVAPVVRTTTVVTDRDYAAYDYYNVGFVNYDYNFDYDYDDSPIDVTMTTVEVY